MFYFSSLLNEDVGFTKFTQLHVVTSQFVMFIPCALRVRIEDGIGSRHVNWTRRSSVQVPCEVNFHLQLAMHGRSFILQTKCSIISGPEEVQYFSHAFFLACELNKYLHYSATATYHDV